jgi:hypothetical protein
MDEIGSKNIFSNRQSIRLPGYDYSQPGYYFITLCTQDSNHLFGEITGGKMILNDVGASLVVAQ